ncbi:hypothetical protein A1O7_04827 [Cladophialophora yegresii CBS 114405]|uniref:Uncharacterized protein n=1 Tax=Cladophialophora yegresii CBS 114405 TaxID=1182544 RepID=W9WQL7_9EURO|nr:uncharacterized protein A1O7_04827 [Cladophialophora yegresii CBS 114405]EXJ60674.1 hypothetical protein A1O7_04827 [Cladophialophora yegresii CBS 114405]
MAGFICREISADTTEADDLASVVQGLFYSAPPVFALPLYTFLLCSPVSTELLPWLNQTISYIVIWALTSAIISCTAQGCATYFDPAAKRSAITSALALLKASLFLQLSLNAVVLCVLVVVFMNWRNGRSNGSHRGISGLLTEDADAVGGRRGPTARSSHIFVVSLLGLTVLLVVRNVFRTVQVFMSPLSGVWVDEAYFWVFEACVMVCFSGWFHVVHPARYVSLGYACGLGGPCA